MEELRLLKWRVPILDYGVYNTKDVGISEPRDQETLYTIKW